MTERWSDARGCLTAAGLARLESAAPGQAPPELAAHVAGCPSCQERLLRREGSEGRSVPTPARRGLWRNLTLVLVALLMALLLLSFTLGRLRSP